MKKLSLYLFVLLLISILSPKISSASSMYATCDNSDDQHVVGINRITRHPSGNSFVPNKAVIKVDENADSMTFYMRDFTRVCKMTEPYWVKNGGLAVSTSDDRYVEIYGGEPLERFLVNTIPYTQENRRLIKTIKINIKKILQEEPSLERKDIIIDYSSWIEVDSRSYYHGSFTLSLLLPRRWQGLSTTTPSHKLARPGQSIKFNHQIKSVEKHNVGTPVSWDSTITAKSGNHKGSTGQAKQSLSIFVNSADTYMVRNADVGENVCSSITYSPASLNMPINTSGQSIHGSAGAKSNPACTYIPHNYEINPCINSPMHSIKCGATHIPGEPGEDTGIEIEIPNEETPPYIKYTLTTWRVPSEKELIPKPDKEILDSPDSDTCRVYNTNFQNSILDCSAQTKVNDRNFNNPFPTIPRDAQLGERYCTAISVSPYKMSYTEDEYTQKNKVLWRHSIPLCLLVVKKPKLQIWNNGIFSNSNILTSKTKVDGEVFGSWVEYELVSNGQIHGLTSGSSHTDDNLTLSNNSPEKGNFHSTNYKKTSYFTSKIKKLFPVSKDSGRDSKLWIQDFSNHSNYDFEGYLGDLFPNGQTVVVYANNLLISGNITKKDSSDGYQQIIIVANNIFIDPSVTNIDAWLISSNTTNTCSPDYVGSDIFVTDDNCGNQLTVNGAITTNHLNPYRTFGNRFTSDPSEIYNNRPDIFLWWLRNMSPNIIRTTYTKELPVRY